MSRIWGLLPKHSWSMRCPPVLPEGMIACLPAQARYKTLRNQHFTMQQVIDHTCTERHPAVANAASH